MVKRVTKFVPGYVVRGKIFICGKYHHELGDKAWEHFTLAIEDGAKVWLEYGLQLGYEYLEDGIVVKRCGDYMGERIRYQW